MPSMTDSATAVVSSLIISGVWTSAWGKTVSYHRPEKRNKIYIRFNRKDLQYASTTDPANIGVQPIDHRLVLLRCVTLPGKQVWEMLTRCLLSKLHKLLHRQYLSTLASSFSISCFWGLAVVWSAGAVALVVAAAGASVHATLLSATNWSTWIVFGVEKRRYQLDLNYSLKGCATSVAEGRNSAQLKPDSLQAAATVLLPWATKVKTS